ncbi:acyl-CoA desaturase [Undibacterium sp.]|uniref:acyl-CoA desaturase n=1 Tax=Undibacterium sp. TaxID=1914977 RepID=UPI00374DE12E
MPSLSDSLKTHRVSTEHINDVVNGRVSYSPLKSSWFIGMATAALVGGTIYFSWMAVLVFLLSTATVLLLGHSLGSHRKLIHDSYQCPKWLEYTLVYFGVQVGLAGPLGLLGQHDLRDYAQRLPVCHDYLRHGRSFWRDGWWQLHCELQLDHPPQLKLEERIALDSFYRFLERTWMLQQLPPALVLYALGGWGFVFWGVCARVTAGVLGHWLIGYFAHNHGGMHYRVNDAAVQGRNIRLTSLLTMGECWHNNHHAFPGSARLGLFAGEWDPGWWMLMLLCRAGLVWGIKLPHDLPKRAELEALDAADLQLQYLSAATLRYHARHVVAAKPSLAKLIKLMLCHRSAVAANASLQGPAATASASVLQKVIGPEIHFMHEPASARLHFRSDEIDLQGLPGLLFAASLRNRLASVLAIALMPFAMGVERCRSILEPV